jgi:hypothetical protein
MGIADKWRGVNVADFAADYLQEIRSGVDVADGFRDKAVLMGFSAPPEIKWAFLQAAVDGAETEDELGSIAAGPFEDLLGQHGDQYIDLVEARCRVDAKFARMTTAAWRHMMSDDIWGRIQAIQAQVPDPL